VKRAAAVVLAAALAASCGTDASRLRGVVVDVTGDLESVSAFEIVTGEGDRLVFVPGPDLNVFEHGAPLSHLAEHLRTGEPIRVTYAESDGMLVAEIVEDAG
jgi:hypothetical protein